ncbi:MAG: cyclase family protein, partial [Bacteroidota bacterium]
MKITDLSHIINNDITVFNEAEKPEITVSATHKKDGYAQKKLSLYSHNSTHVDAPFHIIPGAATLDELSPDTFYGNAMVADCRNTGKEITIRDLENYADKLKAIDFIILNTGWYKKWNTPE